MSDDTTTTETLTRRNFLTSATFVAAAAACVACGNCIVAEAAAPPKPGAPAAGGGFKPVPGEYDVGPFSAFLKAPNGVVVDKFAKAPSGFLLVVNEGKVYALTSVCTHKGEQVKAMDGGKQAICPKHDSVFDLDGTPAPVTPDGDKTPARKPLARHGISVNKKGNLVVDTNVTIEFEKRDQEGAFVELKKPAAGGAKKKA